MGGGHDESTDPLCGPKHSLKPNHMDTDAWKSRWGRKPHPAHPCHWRSTYQNQWRFVRLRQLTRIRPFIVSAVEGLMRHKESPLPALERQPAKI